MKSRYLLTFDNRLYEHIKTLCRMQGCTVKHWLISAIVDKIKSDTEPGLREQMCLQCPLDTCYIVKSGKCFWEDGEYKREEKICID